MRDKARYEVERSHYTGPWRVEKQQAKHTSRSSEAPKRPQSAFLAYVQRHRNAVKKAHPLFNAIAVTTYLSKTWKKLSEEERTVYYNKNWVQRQIYDVKMAEYKERQESERKRREEEAEQEAIEIGMYSPRYIPEPSKTPTHNVPTVSFDSLDGLIDLSSPQNVVDVFEQQADWNYPTSTFVNKEEQAQQVINKERMGNIMVPTILPMEVTDWTEKDWHVTASAGTTVFSHGMDDYY